MSLDGPSVRIIAESLTVAPPREPERPAEPEPRPREPERPAESEPRPREPERPAEPERART